MPTAILRIINSQNPNLTISNLVERIHERHPTESICVFSYNLKDSSLNLQPFGKGENMADDISKAILSVVGHTNFEKSIPLFTRVTNIQNPFSVMNEKKRSTDGTTSLYNKPKVSGSYILYMIESIVFKTLLEYIGDFGYAQVVIFLDDLNQYDYELQFDKRILNISPLTLKLKVHLFHQNSSNRNLFEEYVNLNFGSVYHYTNETMKRYLQSSSSEMEYFLQNYIEDLVTEHFKTYEYGTLHFGNYYSHFKVTPDPSLYLWDLGISSSTNSSEQNNHVQSLSNTMNPCWFPRHLSIFGFIPDHLLSSIPSLGKFTLQRLELNLETLQDFHPPITPSPSLLNPTSKPRFFENSNLVRLDKEMSHSEFLENHNSDFYVSEKVRHFSAADMEDHVESTSSKPVLERRETDTKLFHHLLLDLMLKKNINAIIPLSDTLETTEFFAILIPVRMEDSNLTLSNFMVSIIPSEPLQKENGMTEVKISDFNQHNPKKKSKKKKKKKKTKNKTKVIRRKKKKDMDLKNGIVWLSGTNFRDVLLAFHNPSKKIRKKRYLRIPKTKFLENSTEQILDSSNDFLFSEVGNISDFDGDGMENGMEIGQHGNIEVVMEELEMLIVSHFNGTEKKNVNNKRKEGDDEDELIRLVVKVCERLRIWGSVHFCMVQVCVSVAQVFRNFIFQIRRKRMKQDGNMKGCSRHLLKFFNFMYSLFYSRGYCDVKDTKKGVKSVGVSLENPLRYVKIIRAMEEWKGEEEVEHSIDENKSKKNKKRKTGSSSKSDVDQTITMTLKMPVIEKKEKKEKLEKMEDEEEEVNSVPVNNEMFSMSPSRRLSVGSGSISFRNNPNTITNTHSNLVNPPPPVHVDIHKAPTIPPLEKQGSSQVNVKKVQKKKAKKKRKNVIKLNPSELKKKKEFENNNKKNMNEKKKKKKKNTEKSATSPPPNPLNKLSPSVQNEDNISNTDATKEKIRVLKISPGSTIMTPKRKETPPKIPKIPKFLKPPQVSLSEGTKPNGSNQQYVYEKRDGVAKKKIRIVETEEDMLDNESSYTSSSSSEEEEEEEEEDFSTGIHPIPKTKPVYSGVMKLGLGSPPLTFKFARASATNKINLIMNQQKQRIPNLSHTHAPPQPLNISVDNNNNNKNLYIQQQQKNNVLVPPPPPPPLRPIINNNNNNNSIPKTTNIIAPPQPLSHPNPSTSVSGIPPPLTISNHIQHQHQHQRQVIPMPIQPPRPMSNVIVPPQPMIHQNIQSQNRSMYAIPNRGIGHGNRMLLGGMYHPAPPPQMLDLRNINLNVGMQQQQQQFGRPGMGMVTQQQHQHHQQRHGQMLNVMSHISQNVQNEMGIGQNNVLNVGAMPDQTSLDERFQKLQKRQQNQKNERKD